MRRTRNRIYALLPLLCALAGPPLRCQGQTKTKTGADLAADAQKKLDDSFTGLDTRLAGIQPCRFNELDTLFKELDRLRQEATNDWKQYFSEMQAWYGRQADVVGEDIKKLPEVLSKERKSQEVVKQQLANVQERRKNLDIGPNPTDAQKEALKALDDLEHTLSEELRTHGDVIDLASKEGAQWPILSQASRDLAAKFESLGRIKDTESAKYDLLFQSKKHYKMSGCNPGLPRIQ